MSQLVQELIDKIKIEGVQEAEQKATAIEQDAQKRAETIVQHAHDQAQRLINDAEERAKKIRESTQLALEQVSRDTLLQLRKEIRALLSKVIASDIDHALTVDALGKIIGEVIKGYFKQKNDVDEILVTVSDSDLEKLRDGFFTKLKQEVKKPIVFHSSDDIHSGFTISFDKGKSSFDFTDSSLVEYLSGYLNKEVSSLLSYSISS